MLPTRLFYGYDELDIIGSFRIVIGMFDRAFNRLRLGIPK